MSTKFTLTGTFYHDDGVTPAAGSGLLIKADPYPDATLKIYYTHGVPTATDITGSFSVSLESRSSLWYTITSRAKVPLFRPIRFQAPAADTTTDITALTFYNPGPAPVETIVAGYANSAQTSANDAAASASAAATSASLPTGGAVDQTLAGPAGLVTWVQEPALVADPARYSGIDLTGATASTGLQTLINSLGSSSYQKSIQLLPGIYYNPTGFTLDRPNVELRGAGPGSTGISGSSTGFSTTELRASSAGASVLTIGNTSSTDWRGCQVRNVGFSDSSAGANQVTAGVNVARQNGVVLEDVRIHDMIAATAIFASTTSGNPQYVTVTRPQVVNVLSGVNVNSGADWVINGGYLWGVNTSATAPRSGGIGIADTGSLKTFGVSVQYFETEVQLTGTNSQHMGLTIESLNGFTTSPRVGVEFTSTAIGNKVFMEFANANKYSTGRAASLLSGSARNVVYVSNAAANTTQRVFDDNFGQTYNEWFDQAVGHGPMRMAGIYLAGSVTSNTSTTAYAVADGVPLVKVTGSTAGYTVTLPSPVSGGNIGRVITIKNAATVSITVATAAGSIDTAATVTLAAHSFAQYWSDGITWLAIA